MDEEGISKRLDALEKKRAELHDRLEHASNILSDVDARMAALHVGSPSDETSKDTSASSPIADDVKLRLVPSKLTQEQITVNPSEKVLDRRFLFSETIDDVPAAVVLKDEKGFFIYANKTVHDALGLPMGSLIGTTDYDWSSAELANEHRAKDLSVFTNRISTETIERSKTLDGMEIRWFSQRFLIISGARPVLAIISMNVTELVTAHGELRASEIARGRIQHMETVKHQLRQLAERLNLQK